MFLKYFGLSLLADNRETFLLSKLTIERGFIISKAAGGNAYEMRI